jgi:TatD DNase family protein
MDGLIDIGANLTHSSFDTDRDAVVERAFAAGVRHQIVTGADLPSSRQAQALAQRDPGRLSSTAGVHPHHAAGYDASMLEDFTALLQSPRVVAVGECGLDYFRNLSPRDAQRRCFVAQLELAVHLGKPVFLHERAAHADFAAILRDYAGALVGGVAHCFTGSVAEVEIYLGLGMHIGVTGWICDERRGEPLRQAVTHVPQNRLLLETDAPYLLPRDLSPAPASRRNEPAHLKHIARVVAGLRGETLEALATASTANARRLFRLPDGPAGGTAASPAITGTGS